MSSTMNEIIAEHDEYFRKFEILKLRKGQLISISGDMHFYRKGDDPYALKDFICNDEFCLLLNVFKKNENPLLHGYTIPYVGKAIFDFDNAFVIQILVENKILNLRCYYDCISFID